MKIDKKYIDDFRRGYIAGVTKAYKNEVVALKKKLKDDAKVIELIKRKK